MEDNQLSAQLQAHDELMKSHYVTLDLHRRWLKDNGHQATKVYESKRASTPPARNPHVMSAQGLKLAQKNREREGVSSLPIQDALIARGEASKVDRLALEMMIDQHQFPHHPSITKLATTKGGEEPVSDRLYQDSRERLARKKEEQLRKMLDSEIDTNPYAPKITTAAQALRRKAGHDVSSDLFSLAVMRQSISGRAEPDHRPTINPISDAIASRLPETARERIQRPRTTATPERPTFSPAIGRNSRTLSARRKSAIEGRSWFDYQASGEELKQAKLEELRHLLELSEAKQCTFAPQINTRAARSAESTFDQRAERWKNRRDIRVQNAREHESARIDQQCTFRPSTTQYQKPTDDWSDLYGGDGLPWGYHPFVARQQDARMRAQAELERKERILGGSSGGTKRRTEVLRLIETSNHEKHWKSPTADDAEPADMTSEVLRRARAALSRAQEVTAD